MTSSINTRYVGQKVIIRTYSAGNFHGEVVEFDEASKTVVLKNSRMLWDWFTDKGITLSEIATYGPVLEKSKITTVIPERILTEVIEIIPATAEASALIESAEVYVYAG